MSEANSVHSPAVDNSPAMYRQRLVLPLSMAFFVLSGFAALIYQSVWSTYLGLILGHAAYAQALVLSIFMGGMAIGAWGSSRINISPYRLLFAYAIVEIAIGLLGLLFHGEYRWLESFSLNSVLPKIDSSTTALVWQWGSGAALVLPQSILLGMTFPILGAACVQGSRTNNSSVLGSLYFANSIGAAFGAIFATFVLVPRVGTPGALHFAGMTNLVIGLLAAGVAYWERRPESTAAITKEVPALEEAQRPNRTVLVVMLWASLITGATSFVYELGWVRMLSLAMGSTVHSFELMLSAFILGLALGGLWVRRWKQRGTTDLIFGAAIAQVGMGVVSLLCLLVYSESFDFISWLIAAARPSNEGYTLYLFGSATLSLLTVMPAAFFAGMTLPLMTAAVISAGHGTDKIGKIYAANTLGAIIGVFATIHLLVPFVGVRLSFVVAALSDVFLGVVLLRFYSGEPRRLVYIGSMIAAVAALAFAEIGGRLELRELASGVFRGGVSQVADTSRVAYLRDGKTATISVQINDELGFRSIATNGKTDATVQVLTDKPASDDEITMVMAASLPLAARERFERVAVIGFGSGLTTHTLLGSSRVGSVDTIEIEAAMVEGARAFGKTNERAYLDPRSQIVINDARTYFASGNKHYDLIVAEPSNPWVSGVASLFTVEFYDEVRRHLNPRGLLVQWIQSYELNDALLATMVAALKDRFAFVDIYVTNGPDLLLVARQEEDAFPQEFAHLKDEQLKDELARRGIAHSQSYTVRKIANTDGVEAYVHMFAAVPHSDFYPVVSMQGPRARFVSASSALVPVLGEPIVPLQQMAHGRAEIHSVEGLLIPGASPDYPIVSAHFRAEHVRRILSTGKPSLDTIASVPGLVGPVTSLLELSSACREGPELAAWTDALIKVAVYTLPYLPPETGGPLYDASAWMQCTEPGSEQGVWLQLMHAIAVRDAGAMNRLAIDLSSASSSPTPTGRSYLVLTAMLARLKLADYDGVIDAEIDLGFEVPRGSSHYPLRSYMVSMATVLKNRP